MTRMRIVFTSVPILLLLVAVAGYIVWRQYSSIPAEGIPNYNAPLKFSVGVTSDERASLKTMLSDAQNVLNASPDDMNAWIAVGVARKEAGDYRGAEEVWLYAAQKWPSADVSFNNLGDLYMNYLKDFPKAEENYKKLITLKPDNINAYRSLSDLYRYFYKTDTSAAADILEQGLKANPGNADLLALQEQLKEGK